MALRGKGKNQVSPSGDPRQEVLAILHQQAYNKMLAMLKNILKTEVKRPDSSGKDQVDYVATVSLIRTKCQQTIEDVESYDKFLYPDEGE